MKILIKKKQQTVHNTVLKYDETKKMSNRNKNTWSAKI